MKTIGEVLREIWPEVIKSMGRENNDAYEVQGEVWEWNREQSKS